MSFVWRMIAWGCGTAVFLALVAWITVNATSSYILREKHFTAPETVRAATGPEAIAEGRRLGELYGCQRCHGDDLRGHAYTSDPTRVRNYAPNLTRIAARYSDAQLAQAIRQGVRPTTGQALWDMPSAAYATMPDEELAQVLAFMRSLPAGGGRDPSDTPGLRGRLAILRGRTGDVVRGESSAPERVAAARAVQPADPGPDYAQGRLLATTTCSGCHGSDLRGDRREGGPDLTVAGGFDLPQLQRALRTHKGLQAFTDAELGALHDYLKVRAASEP